MEIERKFVPVKLPDNLESYPHTRIEQGYLCTALSCACEETVILII